MAKWIRISKDCIVNVDRIAAVEKREDFYESKRGRGIFVHVSGAKVRGIISLDEFIDKLGWRAPKEDKYGKS